METNIYRYPVAEHYELANNKSNTVVNFGACGSSRNQLVVDTVDRNGNKKTVRTPLFRSMNGSRLNETLSTPKSVKFNGVTDDGLGNRYYRVGLSEVSESVNTGVQGSGAGKTLNQLLLGE